MSVAEDFRVRWGKYRLPNGERGFVGVTANRDHFMLLSGGGLWTSFGVGRPFFMPWITCNEGGHGNFTAMVHLRENGRNIWAGMQKLVRAEFREVRPLGIVEAAMEYADTNHAVRLDARFTFANGCAGWVVEPMAITNLGKQPIKAAGIYFIANAGGGEKVVPLSDKHGWQYADGRKTEVVAVDGGRAEFWIEQNGRAHPDVEMKLPTETEILPNDCWRPTTPMAAEYALSSCYAE